MSVDDRRAMTEPTITTMMDEFAQDALSFAQHQYQTKLDYSDESIRAIEEILNNLYGELPRNESGEISKEASVQQTVEAICNMFGGYLVEVIRRQFGGKWKIETKLTERPMVSLQVKGTYIFPPAKIYKRLAEGSGDDVWFYYQVVKQRIGEQSGKD